MQDELRLMIRLFEKKVDEVENEYREKHKDNFDVVKMKKYANKKLRKERETLIQMSISPVIQIVNETEKYKFNGLIIGNCLSREREYRFEIY